MTGPVEGPSGQTLTPLDKSKLPKREATAEEMKKLESIGPRGSQEFKEFRAENINKALTENKVQTVFRRNGEEIAHVEDDGAVMIKNSLAEFNPMIDAIKDDSSLSQGQKADRLSQKLASALTDKFGSGVEIQHYSEGNEITQGELRAQRGGYDSVKDYLLDNHRQLVMDTNAFADIFGEK